MAHMGLNLHVLPAIIHCPTTLVYLIIMDHVRVNELLSLLSLTIQAIVTNCEGGSLISDFHKLYQLGKTHSTALPQSIS